MPKGQGGGGNGGGGGDDGKKEHYARFKVSKDDKGRDVKASAVRVRSTPSKQADNIIQVVSDSDALTSDGVAVDGWYEVKLADGRKGYVSAEVVDLNTQKPENRRAKRGEIVTRIKTLFEQLRVALEELQTLE